MRLLLHGDTLNYRGTTVALTDYATFNQELLDNESIITYCKSHGTGKDTGNVEEVINNLKSKFEVVGYEHGELDSIIEKYKIDTTYFIRAGHKDYLPSTSRTAVHAVFQFNEPHGDRYAYISKWLSDHVSRGTIPYVPHMVNLPTPTGNYRDKLGISNDKIVVGRIGGYYTFDIPEVKNYIKELITRTDQFIFLFVGTEPFIDHPNVRFINEISDPQKKSNYIATCDCMLHARMRGESFGLSIAEFLSLGKPVLAWQGGHDLNHVSMLEKANSLYSSIDHLNDMIHNIKKVDYDWASLTNQFTPTSVMKLFKETFL